MKFGLVAAALALASACGGGGGGGVTAPPPVNQAPNAIAGNNQTVQRNVTVTLNGTATDDGGVAGLSYSWAQVGGTAVTLNGANTQVPTFVSPNVGADEVLTFELTVTDSGGLSDTATVTVTVLRNQAPTASAGVDQTVEQTDGVTLDGSGSTDDDGAGNLTYLWQQTSGPAVTLTNATGAQATFTAPNVTVNATLIFTLTITDQFGESSTDEVIITVFEDLTASTVSGKIQFEFVPFGSNALNYSALEMRPVRGATVQLIDAANPASVLAETVTNAQGDYTLPATTGASVFVRVRAELKRTGLPAWDVEVRDNTSSTNLPLAQRPLYVLDGQTFTAAAGPQTVDLDALSGWTGVGYGDPRASAPFSVLDTIYNAVQLVLSADPDAVFAPLDAFWSVNNTPTVTNNRNLDNGEIGTSFYRGDLDSLFLLGDENVDTEEFDVFVTAHEWGHYFEDNFSRADSIGGSHNLVQRLDPRLAFGEGWGNAVSAMINPGRVYFDTQGTQQSNGFSFSLEDNGATSTTRGWYNELSVQSILYDLFDSDDDTGDTISLGFGPLYEVLVNEQASGVPFTTIYPFMETLRNNNPGIQAQVGALLSQQRINSTADEYGTGETEGAGQSQLTLPIYRTLSVGAAPLEVCSSNTFDPDEDGNKLAVRQFVRFSIPAAGNYNVSVITNNPPAAGQSDPDVAVFQGQTFIGVFQSGDANQELFTMNGLTAGDYVMEVYEFSYLRGSTPAIAQPNDQTCFDITLTN